ncbi:hypothetical protein FHT87_005909 [Rhizobium sp. BK316]|nr:hypothetical protein [Rhizobium sp. BK316]
MPFTLEADVINGRLRPYAGDDILELAAAGLVEQDVIRDDRLHLVPNGHVGNIMQPHLVVRSSAQAERNISTVIENCRHFPKLDRAALIR